MGLAERVNAPVLLVGDIDRGGVFAQIYGTVALLRAEERGIPFLNYNDELASGLNDDPSNYSDWGHMSKKGSTAFSKILAKDLRPVLAEVTAGEE